ncbi:tRNA-uridine aminocarboxypropyltransferase [Catenovulum maritimum]|uniref:tRNA-uridine aminocarboxypropyltransferase n=1 Tax=Catenovulum maritimum TaxID=1513271 RepID=A0A0J8GVQ8_9ALTE|nr:DTW domain-containing protein [Catenovulum maritimum]KMT64758.1 hypothetical protein XM47_12930 [Catenovulum maritimum]
MNLDSFSALYQARLARSTRPFQARGIKLKRCPQCFIAEYNCVCKWRPATQSKLDVILIMHSDEILKPTNTGRLISDLLPDNCFTFEWSRTQISPRLLDLLNDETRLCLLVYPTDTNKVAELTPEMSKQVELGKTLTLVVLDGTWRQSKKMYNQSDWLQVLPSIDLNIENASKYLMRKAPEASQLSTAQAAAIAMGQVGESKLASVLLAYFDVFNLHYYACRMTTKVEEGELHQVLRDTASSL